MTVKSSSMDYAMPFIEENAEYKLKSIDGKNILTEAHQWTTCTKQLILDVRNGTKWTAETEISSGEVECRLMNFQNKTGRRKIKHQRSQSMPSKFGDTTLNSKEPAILKSVNSENDKLLDYIVIESVVRDHEREF